MLSQDAPVVFVNFRLGIYIISFNQSVLIINIVSRLRLHLSVVKTLVYQMLQNLSDMILCLQVMRMSRVQRQVHPQVTLHLELLRHHPLLPRCHRRHLEWVKVMSFDSIIFFWFNPVRI